MKLNIFIICLISVLIVTHSTSQVSVYTFSQSIGSYNAITGGTVFGNSTTDDQVFVNPFNSVGNNVGTSGPGLPIGFNFVFNGVTYDRIGVNANGFIFFGQSTFTPAVNSQVGNAYAPISTTSSALPILQQKVVAFGRDLEAKSPTAEIRVETTGLPLIRVCTIQWTGFGKWNSTGDDYNFQIRLLEFGNAIEIVYGTFVNNAVNSNSQVGLRGLNVTDFNNRFVNAINTWPISAQGSLPNTVANIDNTLFPPVGLTYRWDPPPPCTGTPATNTVLASLTTICPGGTSTLSLANSYTNAGITYQWLSSTTSSTSGFVNVSMGGTAATYTPTNINSSTWFRCNVTCANSGASVTTNPLLVSTVGSIVSTVPFQEDFESILLNNSLPNCSWAVSTPTICQTYTSFAANNRVPHSGAKFAAFKSGTNVNGDYFYTNAIKLNAGITYSASVWYITDGGSGWTNFSLLYGTTQTPAGLTSIATLTGNINSFSYQQLSNTFTVPTTGNYFLAIKCIGNATPQFFSFDDISLTAPCHLNLPQLNIAATSTNICEGDTSKLMVSGANSYTWTGGFNTNSLAVTPTINTTYFVIGTNTTSACSNTLSQFIQVKPLPTINIVKSNANVCAGKTTTLTGIGAATNYLWNNSDTTNYTIITPTANSNYTLIATDSNGCSSTNTIQVTVEANPSITVSAIPQVICAGDLITMTASGADTYEWKSNNLYSTGSAVAVSPNSTSTYTLTGINSKGCSSTVLLTANVEACTGINELIGDTGLNISPNPAVDNLQLNFVDSKPREIFIFDELGKLCITKLVSEKTVMLNINNLNKGIYFIQLKSSGNLTTKKFVKE
jgi:hypothetical protein